MLLLHQLFLVRLIVHVLIHLLILCIQQYNFLSLQMDVQNIVYILCVYRIAVVLHICWQYNFCVQEGWTALHLACEEGHDDTVKILMRAKADLNLQTKVSYNS